MELTKFKIENFRSIKSETISLDHNCLILLGKNEAGKSNVLKAIASVFGEYSVSNKDKRKRIDNEEIKEYFVRAVLKLDENDFEEVLDIFNSKYDGVENVVFQGGKTIIEFIRSIFH